MEDLRLQGKRELGSLMKWRTKIHRALAKKTKESAEKSRKEAKDMQIEEKDNDTDSEIEEQLRKAQLKEIREKRKEREVLLHRIAKQSDPARGNQMFHEVTKLNFLHCWMTNDSFEIGCWRLWGNHSRLRLKQARLRRSWWGRGEQKSSWTGKIMLWGSFS